MRLWKTFFQSPHKRTRQSHHHSLLKPQDCEVLPGNARKILVTTHLAMIRLHAGDYRSALKFIRLALHAYAQHGIRDGARLAEYQHALAFIEEANGDSRAAAKSFQISLATLTRANRTQSLEAIGILKDYASLLRRMGRGSEARKIEGRANKESKQLMKDNPFRYSVVVSTLIREHR